MVRITETSDKGEKVSLKLEGKLTDEWVEKLKEICLRHKDKENKTVLLDFSGVTFIDHQGLQMLEKISDDRTRITNCSLFIHSLLRRMVERKSREGNRVIR